MTLTPDRLRDAFEDVDHAARGGFVYLDMREGEDWPATITLDGTWDVLPLIERLTAAFGGNP